MPADAGTRLPQVVADINSSIDSLNTERDPARIDAIKGEIIRLKGKADTVKDAIRLIAKIKMPADSRAQFDGYVVSLDTERDLESIERINKDIESLLEKAADRSLKRKLIKFLRNKLRIPGLRTNLLVLLIPLSAMLFGCTDNYLISSVPAGISVFPVIAVLAGLGLAVSIFFALWRAFFPVSRYLWILPSDAIWNYLIIHVDKKAVKSFIQVLCDGQYSLIRERNPSTYRLIIWRLGESGDRQAIELLIEMLVDFISSNFSGEMYALGIRMTTFKKDTAKALGIIKDMTAILNIQLSQLKKSMRDLSVMLDQIPTDIKYDYDMEHDHPIFGPPEIKIIIPASGYEQEYYDLKSKIS
jgi:hypothetical protein